MALKKALLDMPNERSSHQQPVPRLGGAAFMPVVLLAVGMLAPRAGLPGVVIAAFLGGAIALFIVSLVDDFLSLSTTIRFAVQFAAAFGILFALWFNWPDGSALSSELPALSIQHSAFSIQLSAFSHQSLGLVVSWSVLTLWIVGLINIYNFMDGIDGIAGLQAVIAGVAWCVFGTLLSAPFVAFLGAVVAAGALGFLTLNWPPAKIFMGDAGSTVLGYIFAVVPLVATVESGWAVRSLLRQGFGGQTARGGSIEVLLIAAVLVVWPFLADGSFTILRRLKNRENILKAHRSHLYQRLVIAGVSHRTVTLVYGGLALIGAVLAWRLLDGAKTGEAVTRLSGEAVGVIGVLFLGLWRWAVMTERLPARRGAGKTVRQ